MNVRSWHGAQNRPQERRSGATSEGILLGLLDVARRLIFFLDSTRAAERRGKQVLR